MKSITGKTAKRIESGKTSLANIKDQDIEEQRALIDLIKTWKVGFFDVETTGLSGDIGTILCGCIKLADGPVLTFRKDKLGGPLYDDREITLEIAKALQEYDMIVTYFGHLFDWKMMESRLFHHYQERKINPLHFDLYFTAKKTFNLHDGRLETLGRHLRIPVRKTHLDWSIWRRADFGDVKSMDYVCNHCAKDVILLERCFIRMKDKIKQIWRRD